MRIAVVAPACPIDQATADRVSALADRFPNGDVPRPAHWTGFRLRPQAIEFWLDRPGRLHDRRRFNRHSSGAWDSTLLYP